MHMLQVTTPCSGADGKHLQRRENNCRKLSCVPTRLRSVPTRLSSVPTGLSSVFPGLSSVLTRQSSGSNSLNDFLKELGQKEGFYLKLQGRICPTGCGQTIDEKLNGQPKMLCVLAPACKRKPAD